VADENAVDVGDCVEWTSWKYPDFETKVTGAWSVLALSRESDKNDQDDGYKLFHLAPILTAPKYPTHGNQLHPPGPAINTLFMIPSFVHEDDISRQLFKRPESSRRIPP
jgi:hypothetical protein